MFKKKRFKVEISMKSGNILTVKCLKYHLLSKGEKFDNITFYGANLKEIKIDFDNVEAVLVTKCY